VVAAALRHVGAGPSRPAINLKLTADAAQINLFGGRDQVGDDLLTVIIAAQINDGELESGRTRK
jgi:hypothetical protein